MQEIKDKVVTFLKKYGMDHGDIDIDANCEKFLAEMEAGLSGADSSLEMIPTYIETGEKVPVDEKVIVMDAGGTNFRAACVSFNAEMEPVIEGFKKFQMPGIEREVSKEEFFEIMAEYVGDVVGASSRIGFCFSYPTEMYPNKDGKVIRFAKEVKAPEVQGQMIGENLAAALKKSGHDGDKHVVILNDTVTTLLAGIQSSAGREFSSYIGFILGTGTNACYIEANKNITKSEGLEAGKSMIINTESGGFGKGPMGEFDKKFDASTNNPGVHTFEKMISGAYLGGLCKVAIDAAAEDGLFSAKAAESLKGLTEVNTKDVSDFVLSSKGDNKLAKAVAGCDKADVVTLYYILDRIIERAAKLTAVNLASMVLKSGKGENPCEPVCIVAEGTTFYNLKGLKGRTEFYMKSYLEDARGVYTEIVEIENSTLIGAAVAGLTN